MAAEHAYDAVDTGMREAFAQDGVVCLRGLLDATWLARLAAAVEQDQSDPGPHHFRFGEPGETGAFFGDVLMWQRWPTFRDFVFEGPLAKAAGQLMDSASVTFYHDFLLVKGAGTSKRTPWHQDQSYWCVGGNQALTIWAPLDPVTAENTLQFVRGSHRWAPVYEAVAFDKSSRFNGSRDGRPPVPDVWANTEQYDLVSWDLSPGDCLVFHCRTLHAAPGNPRAHARRVLSTSWLGDDAHYIEIASDLAPPVKGDGLRPGDALACATFPLVIASAQ